jgi:hypothetical protein
MTENENGAAFMVSYLSGGLWKLLFEVGDQYGYHIYTGDFISKFYFPMEIVNGFLLMQVTK